MLADDGCVGGVDGAVAAMDLDIRFLISNVVTRLEVNASHRNGEWAGPYFEMMIGVVVSMETVPGAMAV